MEQRCRKNGLTLLRSKTLATSTQARNKAIELIDTKYAAFVDVAEFHAQLVAMKAYEEVGLYDENIVNMYDYGEFELRIHERGKKIVLEPGSIVTYMPPKGVPREDREFFEIRWCEAWTDLTEATVVRKFRLTRDHPDAKPPHNFVRRQRMLGKNWLRRPRKILGNYAVRWLERKLLVPIDVFINRRKYPASRYGQIAPAEFVQVT